MIGFLSAEVPLIQGQGPILTLALVLVVGLIFGRIAKSMGLPSITGQIIAGFLMGADVLHVFGVKEIKGLAPITEFALGLIGVAVGSHFQFKRLRNAWKRLGLLLLFEAILIPALVMAAFSQFGASASLGSLDQKGVWLIAPLLAALAVSTAPATIVALVKETHSKGVFVKTLVAAVALNNIACIALFELAHVVVDAEIANARIETWEIIAAPLDQLLRSVILGGSIGLALILWTRRVHRSDRLATYSMVAILLTSGLGEWLHISPLLASLFLGVTLANVTPDKEEIGHAVFVNFEIAIYAAFFVIAGLHLDLDVVGKALFLALLLLVSRFVGKYVAARLSMKLAGATRRVRQYLGLALIPQAGVAIGLIIIVVEDPLFAENYEMRQIRDLFVAIGLSSVLFNEILGPITTRFALQKSGDAGQDRARLIDFLHEENIVTDLEAETKEEAISKLVDVLISSQHLEVDRETLLQSVLDREADFSTCLGSGLAIPHGTLDSGNQILGVMGLSREGLALATPDGQPVHCMILLATPESQRNRHLEVLAAFARAIGRDAGVQNLLYHAKTPAHAYEILHAEESADFNYFLEDIDGST